MSAGPILELVMTTPPTKLGYPRREIFSTGIELPVHHVVGAIVEELAVGYLLGVVGWLPQDDAVKYAEHILRPSHLHVSCTL